VCEFSHTPTLDLTVDQYILDLTVDQYIQDYVVGLINTDTSPVNTLAVILPRLRSKADRCSIRT